MDDLKRFFTLGHVADHVRGVTLKGGDKDGRKLIRTDDGGHIAKEVVPSGVWATVEETRAEVDRLDGRIDATKADLESELSSTASSIREDMASDKVDLENQISTNREEVEEEMSQLEDRIIDEVDDKFAPKMVSLSDDSNDSNDQVELSRLSVGNFHEVQDHVSDFDNPHRVTKGQVGLGNVDNTSDMDKPVSTATQRAIDEVSEKLSSVYRYKGSVNDYSDLPIDGNEGGDVYNIKSDGMNVAWVDDGSNDGYWDDLGMSLEGYLTEEKAAEVYLSKTEASGTYLSKGDASSEYATKSELSSGLAEKANSSDLSTVATTGSYNDLTDKPIIPQPVPQVQSDWDEMDSNDPSFIRNKPAIPQPVPQEQADWDETDSNDVSFIRNKPVIPQPVPQVQSDWLEEDSNDVSFIRNKPVIPAPQVNADWDSESGMSAILNKPRIPEDPVQSDWDETDSNDPSFIRNKPAIPLPQVNSDWNSESGVSKILNKPHIPEDPVQSDWLEEDSNDLSFIRNKPVIPQPVPQVQSDWLEDDSSDVSFIRNKPSIPDPQVNADWNSESGISKILNKPHIPEDPVQSDWLEEDSNDLSFIRNKPTIPDITGKADKAVPAAAGNLASLDATGNLTDSGKKAADFATAAHALTHATGGSDAIAPEDIGAVKAGAISGDFGRVVVSDGNGGVETSGSYLADLALVSSLATVATSGSYDDLLNKPTIPAAQVQADWDETDSNDLSFIRSKPRIPEDPVQSDWLEDDSNDLSFVRNKPSIPIVDSQLSTTSTNAIQNAAVANAIGDIATILDNINGESL